ncbi:MAG: hypothetical protein SFW09_20065 [Hyphomicrobiaceae bacterium]|nr:hypothetical protein [Hyphomicrobiaceae bacterium]
MADTIEPLVRDLVTWCAREPRAYGDVLDAWRTSCPRLMVWETAVERGYLETRAGSRGLEVQVTSAGRRIVGLPREGAALRPPRPATARTLKAPDSDG